MSATVSSYVYKLHPMLATTNSDSPCCAGPPRCIERAVVNACVEGHPVKALLDSWASENYNDKKSVDRLKLNITKEECDVTMASTKLLLKTEGRVKPSRPITLLQKTTLFYGRERIGESNYHDSQGEFWPKLKQCLTDWTKAALPQSFRTRAF